MKTEQLPLEHEVHNSGHEIRGSDPDGLPQHEPVPGERDPFPGALLRPVPGSAVAADLEQV